MTDTQFAVHIPVTVTAFDREWKLTATVSPDFWAENPVLLWLERDEPDVPYWVPEQVWDAVEDQLRTIGTPARDAFDAHMNKAPIPFMAAAE